MKRLSLGLEAQLVDPNLVHALEMHDDTVSDENAIGAIMVDANDLENVQIMEDQSCAMEAMDMYSSNLEYLIATKNFSMETLDVIEFGVQQQLNRLQIDTPIIAVEGITEPEARFEAALEGIDDVYNRVAQAYVLSAKQQVESFMQKRRKLIDNVKKYHEKNAEAIAEYNSKKGSWEETKHKGSLVELWQHFSTKEGQMTNFVAGVEKDLPVAQYVLNTYMGEVVSLHDKAVSLVQNARIKDIASAIEFAKRIEHLSHPMELFDKSLLSKSLMGVYNFSEVKGSKRNPIQIGDVTLGKLAELATGGWINESIGFKHLFKTKAVGLGTKAAVGDAGSLAGTVAAMNVLKTGPVAGAGLLGRSMAKYHPTNLAYAGAAAAGAAAVLPLGQAVFGKSIELTTEEIGKLFKMSDEYLDIVNHHVSQEDQMYKRLDTSWDSFAKMLKSIPQDLPRAERKQIRQITKQVEKYLNNIENCFDHPSAVEVARSLRTASYLRMLGMRMVATAK